VCHLLGLKWRRDGSPNGDLVVHSPRSGDGVLVEYLPAQVAAVQAFVKRYSSGHVGMQPLLLALRDVLQQQLRHEVLVVWSGTDLCSTQVTLP
jgi:hypothetical protein